MSGGLNDKQTRGRKMERTLEPVLTMTSSLNINYYSSLTSTRPLLKHHLSRWPFPGHPT